jgi:hypothetical protein
MASVDRGVPIREGIEHALTGQAQEGSGPGHGEHAISQVLVAAMEKARSPLDTA